MTLLDKTNTLIIVPAYNEQDSIVAVIEEIKATGFPFVVIDDGSTDETRNRAVSAGARTISLPFNAGVGCAVRCGFRYASDNKYRAAIQIDADGQHPVSYLNHLINHATHNDAHMVVGSRFLTQKGSLRVNFIRRFSMVILSLVARYFYGAKVSDTTSGFRMVIQPLLGQFAINFPTYFLGDTFEAIAVAKKHNYVISEISVPISERMFGKSSASTFRASMSYLKVITIASLGIGIKIDAFDKSKLKTE
jgi:glycosyltransferase involved in cell wall biosynthesis